jgi:hypothetical protein
MATILPTQSCFDDAIEYLEMRVRLNPALAWGKTLILVHAICLAAEGPHAGEPFAHAWVEEDGRCGSAGLLDGGERIWMTVAREEWYAAHRVQQSTRYTLRDVWRENQQSGHYGPWRPEYRALCGGGRIFAPEETKLPSITCPRCGRTSYNLNDVRERYCGACHVFLDDHEGPR